MYFSDDSCRKAFQSAYPYLANLFVVVADSSRLQFYGVSIVFATRISCLTEARALLMSP